MRTPEGGARGDELCDVCGRPIIAIEDVCLYEGPDALVVHTGPCSWILDREWWDDRSAPGGSRRRSHHEVRARLRARRAAVENADNLLRDLATLEAGDGAAS